MLVKPEHYKGIFYIRISSLPADQQSKIIENYHPDLILKIIKDNSLINDCVLYDDYVKWYGLFKSKVHPAEKMHASQTTINPVAIESH